MSSAGTASSQGDEYQLCIALYWLIQLLEGDAIRGIQAESMGIPGQNFAVTVDDVVVLFADGHTRFIQAKKNQPQYHNWTFTGFQDELHKAYTQLRTTSNSEVWFYSRSPFGEVQALVEGCRTYPEFAAFVRDAPIVPCK